MSTLTIALLVIDFIEALVFGLFVIIMFVDQVSAIISNTPYIDQLQNKMSKTKHSKYRLLRQVFGEPLSIRWLLPLAQTEELHQQFQQELTVIWQEDYMQTHFQNEKHLHFVPHQRSQRSIESDINQNDATPHPYTNHNNYIEYRSALERFTQLTSPSDSDDSSSNFDSSNASSPLLKATPQMVHR